MGAYSDRLFGGTNRFRGIGQALIKRLSGQGQAQPKQGGKPRDTSGLPTPPQTTSPGNTIRDAAKDIKSQAHQEETQRAGIMATNVQGLAQDIDLDKRQADNRFEGLEEGATQNFQDNQQRILGQQLAVAGMPSRVRQEAQNALQQFKDYAGGQIAEQQKFADQVLSQVAKGQSLAMESAVQGSQAQINNQINMINSDPNIPPSQKATMVSQVRMQGAMTVGPIIGSTILEFNKLQSETATNFGNQLASLRQGAVSGAGALGQTGLSEVGGSFRAAAELGNQLTQMSINNADTIANQRLAINTARWQAEQSGNQMQLALLPELESTIPMYSSIYMDDLTAQVEAMNYDNQHALNTYGMGMTTMMYQQQRNDQRFNALSGLLGMIPGVGPYLQAGVGALGAFQQAPSPQPGWGG